MTLKNHIHINQLAIVCRGYNIKGATLDTWALFDFLYNYSKATREQDAEGGGWFWVNSYYIKTMLPLCRFNKEKIKKHLDLLEKAGLIELKVNTEGYLLCRAIKPIEL